MQLLYVVLRNGKLAGRINLSDKTIVTEDKNLQKLFLSMKRNDVSTLGAPLSQKDNELADQQHTVPLDADHTGLLSDALTDAGYELKV